MRNIHHALNYIEFPTKDISAAKKFYGDVFGWIFTDYGADYVAFKDRTLDGGFYKGETTDKGPLVIFYSKDLEASQRAIETAGGRISKPIFTFPGGKRFHFLDPAGNQLAVWSDT